MESEHCPNCGGLMDYKFTEPRTGEHLYWCPACKEGHWVKFKEE